MLKQHITREPGCEVEHQSILVSALDGHLYILALIMRWVSPIMGLDTLKEEKTPADEN
jgi:hypothetical protein